MPRLRHSALVDCGGSRLSEAIRGSASRASRSHKTPTCQGRGGRPRSCGVNEWIETSCGVSPRARIRSISSSIAAG